MYVCVCKVCTAACVWFVSLSLTDMEGVFGCVRQKGIVPLITVIRDWCCIALLHAWYCTLCEDTLQHVCAWMMTCCDSIYPSPLPIPFGMAYAWIGSVFRTLEKLLALHPAIKRSEIENESQWCLGVENPAFSNIYIYIYVYITYSLEFGCSAKIRNPCIILDSPCPKQVLES